MSTPPTDELTQVTVNFTPAAIGALNRIATRTGDSRTDVVNIAVMGHEQLLDLIAEGDGRTLRVLLPDGAVRELRLRE